MKHSKFVLKRGRTGKYRFNLVAANGEVVATSEQYVTKAKCIKGCHAVVNAVYDMPAGDDQQIIDES